IEPQYTDRPNLLFVPHDPGTFKTSGCQIWSPSDESPLLCAEPYRTLTAPQSEMPLTFSNGTPIARSGRLPTPLKFHADRLPPNPSAPSASPSMLRLSWCHIWGRRTVVDSPTEAAPYRMSTSPASIMSFRVPVRVVGTSSSGTPIA